MPRPNLPRLVAPPKVSSSFRLDAGAKRAISAALGLKSLPKTTGESICWAVNCYRATMCGSETTTVANTLLALSNLEKPGRSREEAIELLAHNRAGVDYTTHNALQALAKAALQKAPGTYDALTEAARRRAAELADHPRIATSTEPMRFFCGVLREIFNSSAVHLKNKITPEEAGHRCRCFAIEIFTAAGIEHADFDAHPERLTKYLGTDVTVD
jgi:hypothetical protein